MKKTRMLLAIAATAVMIEFAVPVSAQFKVNNGNALDANTQGGSYGSNSPVQPPNTASLNGNQIVTGNATLGRSLQTNPGYAAPSQLRTSTGNEQFEDFIRDSVGTPAPYSGQANFVAPHAFYGGTSTAAPPPGFMRNDTTGAYVPVVPHEPTMGYDTRIGLINPGGVSPSYEGLTPPMSILPQGPISGQQMYGPKQNPTISDLSTNPLFSAYQQWNSQALSQLNPSSIAQMRNELDQSATQQPTPGSGPNAQALNMPPGVTPSTLNPQAMNTGPINASVTAQNNTQNQPGQMGQPNSQISPGLVSPAQQSTEYAELQARFNQLQGQQTGENSPPSISQLLNGQQGTTSSSSSGSQNAPPEEANHRHAELYPPSVPPSPLEIHSLATGIHARGLRNLMADAEAHMRRGQFAEALLRYGTAAEVAPNNPLIALGRAYAELGAGYYARADRDIRTALVTDPVLTMGRYDLKNFFGQDRLEFIVNDLKQIANNDKDNAHAPFLLAYIAYNNGSAAAATDYLNLAEQREHTPDPIYQVLRRDWNLSAPAPKQPSAK